MNKLIGLLVVIFIASIGQAFAQEEVYKIGKPGPAGGLVFYDKGYSSDGWRYLEAAPTDENRKFIWSNINKLLGREEDVEEKIGEGKNNTEAIISQIGHSESAAKQCSQKVVHNNNNTFNDYFLPSIGELISMYETLHKEGKGSFVDHGYWSSSDAEDHREGVVGKNAWGLNFDNGRRDTDWKYNLGFVRCIRRF
ncbi:MAG: hypothetical protein NTY22_06545 [Proteobacteria bacterium]|nr:hypothetical protein [Pseudomonadota bacterium]